MFILIAAAALVVFVLSLVYLVDFARVSRRDALFHPAASAGQRRARRVAGMYTRGTEEQLVPVLEQVSAG